MKVVLKVSSSNENCDGGCEFAVLELTPELAALALRRIAALREQKNLDPDIDEMYYWTCFAEYFSQWRNLAGADMGTEPASLAVADMLEELRIEEKEVVTVPEIFHVPPSQLARVECEQMIVREDSIAFMAIPKHASFYVRTVDIPLTMLEAAAAAGASTIRG